MYYPEDIVEDIRMANDIIDVISGYVALKQKGSNYFGLCPFHHEKSPSFSVSPDKQLYHCFGCGASGNVFSFIMQKENYDFSDAIKFLAERVHMELPEHGFSADMKKRAEIKDTLYDIHIAAARFYYEILTSEEGEKAVLYLDDRKISAGARKKFGLGYSSRKSLFNHLLGKGYDIDAIAGSGLVIPDKKGGYFDRFSNRLMFPIFNVQGKINGFGGRILDKGEPKYLNSPDTPIFDKSKNLYGINYARQAKSKEIIIVEGYMDVIALYQKGIHNVVASLGTAFNAEHAKLLKKYCENVILLFDSDAAGEKAALRAIPILLSNGFKPKILQLKNAKDPDEYINTFGKSSFLEAVSKAVNYVAFQISCMQKEYDMNDSPQKVEFTNRISKLISGLPNAIERDVYIKDAAKITGISADAIKKEVEKLIDRELDRTPAATLKSKPNFLPGRTGNKGVDEAKRNIIRIIASDKNIAYKIKEHLNNEEFTEPFYVKLYDIIFVRYSSGKSVYSAELVNHFDSLDDQKKVSNIFSIKPNYDNESLIKVINDNIGLIKSVYIDEKLINPENDFEFNKYFEAKRNLKTSYISALDG